MAKDKLLETNNPLMERLKVKLPGRTFTIPSRGALYTHGEIASAEGAIHVHPMTAMTEITLKTPDLLFNGKALAEVFRECIPEIKKPNELYTRDIDAIMYYLRLVTYGPIFDIKFKHDCEEAKEHGYSVNIEDQLKNFIQLDPTDIEQFKVTLPSDQVVTVHPVKFEHMIKLFQQNASKKEFSNEDLKKNVIFSLVNLIDNVDGITDKAMIAEWLEGITTPYQNMITDAIQKANTWGPPSAVPLKCKDCGETVQVSLPLDPIQFFSS